MHVGVDGARREITIEQFWQVAARGQRDDVQRLFLRSTSADVAAGPIVLAARGVDAISGGDVSGGTLLLERAMRLAPSAEAEYLLDLLLPTLTSRGDFEAARTYLARCEGRVERLVPAFTAFGAFLAALSGEAIESRHLAARAVAMLGAVDDPLMYGRILFRVAVAAFYRGELDEAYDRALEAARWVERGGSHRLAAVAYYLPCHVAHASYQDADLARYYAAQVRRNAKLAGDVTLENFAVIAQLALASELADVSRMESLLEARDHARLPEQFARESFQVSIVRVLRYGWAGTFEAAGAVIESLRMGPPLNLCEKSLCDALEAVLQLASWDLRRARRLARLAISQTIAPRRTEPLQDAWQRRVARTLAAFVCLCIGDGVRGRRALKTRDSIAALGDVDALLDSTGISEALVPALLRGYVRFLNCAIEASAASRPRANLTRAELEVLRALQDGTTLAQVGRALGKSPKTVRCQVASIYTKLDASNRTQALRRAAEVGVVAPTLPL